MHNRILLYSTAFLRSFATGLMGVAIAIHLAKRNFDSAEIGLLISIGLLGAALAGLVTTFFGRKLGIVRLLVSLSLLSALGGIVFAFANEYWLLVLASFVGMINGMGRDRGSFLILETASLPGTTTDPQRTIVFAWYTFLQDAGVALGGLTLVLINLVSFRTLFLFYSAIFVVTGAIYLLLTPTIALTQTEKKQSISKEGRTAVTKLSLLFSIDAIAGGFLTTALLSYLFYERFAVTATTLGVLFFLARTLNALSHFAAAWLAKRIGLVNTMVLTHIPSSLLLVSLTLAQSFPIAAVLFLLREALVEMDVPTRQSYLMAVVNPHERVFASGITNLVRMIGWAVAPAFAGIFMSSVSIWTPVLIGASLKIGYDVLLYFGFRKQKPPEESFAG